MSSDSLKTKLSDQEVKIMAHSWLCFKSGAPDIDIPKLANMLGYKNPGSVSNALRIIRKKIADGAGGGPTEAGTPKNGSRKRAASGKDTENALSGDEEAPTRSKKRKVNESSNQAPDAVKEEEATNVKVEEAAPSVEQYEELGADDVA